MEPLFTITTQRKRIIVYPNDTRMMVCTCILCVAVIALVCILFPEWVGMMIERAFTIL